jgi:hypothetical protein
VDVFFTPKTIKLILTTSLFEDLHEVLEDYTEMFLKEQYIFTAVVRHQIWRGNH